MVASNSFREDLLFRLNVFPIDVPNLSERHEDIPEIIEYFIEKKSSKTGSVSRPIFDEKALRYFKIMIGQAIFVKLEILWKEQWFFSKIKNIGSRCKKYLLRIDSDVVLRAEEQDAIWSELDELGKHMPGSERQTTILIHQHPRILLDGSKRITLSI